MRGKYMTDSSAKDNFRAIARDPHTIFVYWDADCVGGDKLSGKPGANVRAIIGWTLEVYCCDTKTSEEYSIEPQAGKYYFHGLHSGYTYRVKLCQIDTMKHSHCFHKYEDVTLPRAGFSGVSDPEWAVSPDEIMALIGPISEGMFGASENSGR